MFLFSILLALAIATTVMINIRIIKNSENVEDEPAVEIQDEEPTALANSGLSEILDTDYVREETEPVIEEKPKKKKSSKKQ